MNSMDFLLFTDKEAVNSGHVFDAIMMRRFCVDLIV